MSMNLLHQAYHDNPAVTISTLAELYAIRGLVDLKHVVIITAGLKRRGLLPQAIKFGIWGLSVGGYLEIVDDGTDSHDAKANQMSFGAVCQCAVVLLKRDAVLQDVKPLTKTILFQRTRLPPDNLWSAVVMFSGDPGEVSQLSACLSALCEQPELSSRTDYPILVCGPADAEVHVSQNPLVRYLSYDDPRPVSGRFRIGRKKNFAIAAATSEKVLVIHSRIILAKNCLFEVPADFDILGLNVLDGTVHPPMPYLSLFVADTRYPGWIPRSPPISVRQLNPAKYLDIFRFGTPWIDGGCFALRRAVIEDCPLSEDLAWGEGEDVEWCHRSLLNGFVMDFAPRAFALSSTSKFSGLIRIVPVSVRAPLLKAKHRFSALISYFSRWVT